MKLLEILKHKWNYDLNNNGASIDEIVTFQDQYNIFLPADMVEYLATVNGTQDKYMDDLFVFYSIRKIKPLTEEFKDWTGVPAYHKLIKDFKNAKIFFVIGNYQSNLFSYAIRLEKEAPSNGEVHVFCGEDHKKIANSFSEFIQLYLNDSMELYYND